MKKRIIAVALTLALVFCFMTTAYATMQLFINQQTGKTLTVEIEASDSIRMLKDKIAIQTSVHPDRMRLIYSGKELADTNTIADYNIQKESKLQLVYKLRGNEHPQEGHTGWTAWNDATSLPTLSGDYYLTCDVTLSETWKVPAIGGVYLCLNGHVINANGGDFSAITLEGSSSKLTLFDCDTTTQHAGYVDADGLWHLGTGTGTAKTITGGIITGSSTSGTGGGVNNNGTFTMNGGTIAGNLSKATNNCGGGVYNGKDSIFTLSGGTITGNRAAQNGGGVFLGEDATFTMTGGAVTGNRAGKNGGGVYTYDGTVEMSGGSISGNSASASGGGVYDNGHLIMTGGEINGNSAVDVGGGVMTNADSTFDLQGGTVNGNSADRGGGVYVNPLGTVNMTSGKICNNAARGAGGIYNSANALVNLKADADKTVEISGNEAGKFDGGMANWGELHLSGKVLIRNNTCKESGYPINLATNQALLIDGALTGSEIYATFVNKSTDLHEPGVLTSGYATKGGGTGLTDFFHYDGSDSFAVILNSSNELEVANVYAITNGAKADDKDKNHGCLTVDKTSAMASKTVSVTVEPDSGYQLKTLTVVPTAGGDPITATQDASDETKYTFTMPACAVTVTADFEEIPHIHHPVKVEGQPATAEAPGFDAYYECKDSADACGALFEDADGTVPIDDLETWKAEGGNGYIPPIPKYTVTVTDDGHGTGSADPASGITDTAVTLTAAPADGYELDHWELITGGVTVTDNQFTLGTANVEIKACFRKIGEPPAPVLTGISVTTAPGKTTYTEGETFDKTGMVITATYSDGSTKPVEGYTFKPSGALSVADTAVEISYTENGETKTATLTVKVDPVPPVEYKVIEGANQDIYEGADSATFRSDAEYSKFLYVEVDGNKLGREDYESYSGSTVIVLKGSFIRKLGLGVHTLKIVSNDGFAMTKFTLRKLPDTGDETPVALLALLLVSAIGMAAFVMKKQAKQKAN